MVQWTSDKDAVLLVGIFEYANVKISTQLCTALARKIGEGCTAKAVSHRLNNLKLRGNPTATAQNTPTKNTSAKTTPRKTPTSGRSKKVKNVGDGAGPTDDDEEEIKSPTVGRKRGRSVKKEVDEEEERVGKKVKVKQEVMEVEEDFSGIIGGQGENGYADEGVEDDEWV